MSAPADTSAPDGSLTARPAPALPERARGLIDLAALLAPVSQARPEGVALDDDPVLQKLSDLRREDDPRLPQGVWARELKVADWAGIIKLAGDTLAGRSKDLQIAVRLCEALTVRHGYAGLAAGLILLTGLVARYWDSAHPKPSGRDLSDRLAPFEWLEAKLPRRLSLLPASDPPAERGQCCTFADLQMAVHLERVAQRDPKAFKQAESAGAVTRAVADKSVALTPGAFYQSCEQTCRDALAALDALTDALDGACADDGLTFGALRDALNEQLGMHRACLRDKGLAPLDAPETPAPHGDGPAGAPAGTPGPEPAAQQGRETAMTDRAEASGQGHAQTGATGGDPDAPVPAIRSREDAYARIAQVADYLQRTEPHSPTPYLLRRAIHWGRLDLNQLLLELTGNGMDFMQVMRLLGIGQDESGVGGGGSPGR
ncbi:type VI secretion system protein TssA [Rhodovibrio sodomensis]|uniref:type VI secretion system protein TssA n=1 Tax=Rhodovibrio sodomensis TaxID=1088 RepID=UPI001903ECEC